ncbi:MAG: 4-hydroxythreonine-4-phosphate dehydrogenase [Mycolicibacterium rufum]|nr:4-hydroxythreonine-4-phosphate dehydrogenase [Mycolicibacterium rufum]
MTDRPANPADPVLILADDLSGAAEAASMFLGRTDQLSLRLSEVFGVPDGGVTVVDLDTRAMAADEAQATLRRTLVGLRPGTVVVKKIDSLLRGQVGPEVAVLGERGPVIVAAGLPTLDRVVERGVLHVRGVPLHETRAWHAETRRPPRTVAELFGDQPTRWIPAGPDAVDRLVDGASPGCVLVCDVTADADLDAVITAARAIPAAQLVGTSALAAAVARTRPAGHRAPTTTASGTILTVVGTAEQVAIDQVAALVALGTRHLSYAADDLLGGAADPAALAGALDRGSVVLTVSGAVNPVRAGALCAALGRLVAAGQQRHRPDLVVTGGQTARAVVDAIGLEALRPVDEVHHGAVVSVDFDGRRIVTRPGSFGDTDSLVAITAYLQNPRHDTSSCTTSPQ